MTDATTKLRTLAAAAGFYHSIDIAALLTELRKRPGCESLQERTLRNTLNGSTKRIAPEVALALADVLGVDVAEILRSTK